MDYRKRWRIANANISAFLSNEEFFPLKDSHSAANVSLTDENLTVSQSLGTNATHLCARNLYDERM